MDRKKILLADDSLTIQKVVKLAFSDRDVDVFTFSDGESAIVQLDEIGPDIILADVNMPGISGYDFCLKVRESNSSNAVPVVLLVGSFEPFDYDEAERVGASTHLTKPFTSVPDLIATVGKYLDEAAKTAELPEISAASITDESESEPRVETSDIDNLYAASFTENVNFPDEEIAIEYGDDPIDDEMITTSYAVDPIADEKFDADFEKAIRGDDFAAIPVDEFEATLGGSENYTNEALPDPVQETTSSQSAFDSEALENEAFGGFESEFSEIPVASSQPASFRPLVEQPMQETFQVEHLEIDEFDMLELPADSVSDDSIKVAEKTEEAASPQQIASLSPELIELIVERVLERMGKR